MSTPAQTFLQGIDVSSYQGTDYSTAGLAFAFIKITEGLSYVNPKWIAQRTTARNGGLVTGFYHYPHITNSPSAEADHFLSQINLVAGDIIILDWEWYGQNVSDQQARDYKDNWVAYVAKRCPGHRIVVYADRDNWVNVDTNSNCGDGLWIADYTTAGRPRITHPWVFHQFTDSPLDLNVANFATTAALSAWAGKVPSYQPFPGASWFHTAPKSPIITAMGQRLVVEGCSAYSQGPGPQWTDADKASYARWQEKCGYSGADADGWPGQTTWDKLKVPYVG